MYKRGHPYGETLRCYGAGAATSDVSGELSRDVAEKIAALRRSCVLRGDVSLKMAADKHPTRRSDRTAGALVGTVSNGRGGKYRAHMDARLVVRGARAALAAAEVKAGYKNAPPQKRSCSLPKSALPKALRRLGG